MIALIGACPAISSRNKEAQMACQGVFQIDAGLQGIHACRIAFVLVVHGFDMLETYVSADFQLRQDRVVHSGPVESAE